MAALLSVLALGFSPVPRSSALSLGDAVLPNLARATTPTLSFFDDLKRGMAEARMMATVQVSFFFLSTLPYDSSLLGSNCGARHGDDGTCKAQLLAQP